MNLSKSEKYLLAERVLLSSAAFIFMLTGMAKLVSAFGHSNDLIQANGIFRFFSTRQLYVSLGVIELALVGCILWMRSNRFKLRLIAGFCTCCALYRIALVIFKIKAPCGCLGNALAWTGLDPGMLDEWLKAILICLILFSYCFVFFRNRLLAERNCASLS